MGQDNEFLIKSNSKINEETGCWEWTGSLYKSGSGSICIKSKTMSAARFSFLTFIGELDHPDATVLRDCRNKLCVNPDHLYVGIGGAYDTEQCKHGHKYSKTGDYYYRDGRKACMECKRISCRKHRENNPTPKADPKPPATHCIHGHEWTKENTSISPKGKKTCRKCGRNNYIKRRGEKKRKSKYGSNYCINGHEWTKKNTRIHSNGKTKLCRKCARNHEKKSKERKKNEQ